MPTNRWRSLLLGAAMAIASYAASAADFPAQPIRLIVPFPPGGVADPAARVVAAAMSVKLEQPIIVDNRTGATGAIGTTAVARSTPDGYTLLFHTNGLVTSAATQRENPGYDVVRDFAPISRVASAPYLVVVHPSVPAKSMAEVLQYARANPGKLNHGSSGPGSSNHLAIELFKRMANVDIVHVPFRGGGPQIAAVLAGDIQLVFDTISGSGPLVRSGKLRGVATTGAQRSAAFRDLPTIIESGVPGYEAGFWMGLFAPAGTPRDTVEKLNATTREALAQPDVRARLTEMGLDVSSDSAAEFAQYVRSDLEKWTTLARQLGKLE
jgi:tripartite-type tricarboxylate transporter receptor subunit TctC